MASGWSTAATAADDVLEGAGVGPGGRDHHQVRAFADGLEHRAGHLAGGLGGHRMLGQGAGEGHRRLSRPRGANRMSSERR